MTVDGRKHGDEIDRASMVNFGSMVRIVIRTHAKTVGELLKKNIDPKKDDTLSWIVRQKLFLE